jgi:hypothetical protein
MTIAALLKHYLGTGRLTTAFNWPPDGFALSSSILKHSGAYTRVIAGWFPNPSSGESYIRRVRKAGESWRRSGTPPTAVRRWVSIVLKNRQRELHTVAERQDLCVALLSICAAADEACLAIGIPPPMDDPFYDTCLERLRTNSNLCRRVLASAARVLPKLHTPQSGLTIRSLSHHISLCSA